MSSRCSKCCHRKVCAYKDYYTEKERDKIDKCKNFEYMRNVLRIPKEYTINEGFIKSLVRPLYFMSGTYYSIEQCGKEVAVVRLDKKRKKPVIEFIHSN